MVVLLTQNMESDSMYCRNNVALGVSYDCCPLRDSRFLLHKADVTVDMNIATSRVGRADNIPFMLNW